MSQIDIYQQEHSSEESYWRSIILFGANVASYKFALSKSLLEIIPSGKSAITLEELAEPYSKYICEHIANAPKQATSSTSKFLTACSDFNKGAISKTELLNKTVSLGFNNVIDAFHNVNGGEIPVKFYEKDYKTGSKKIILTDEIFKLQDMVFYDNLMSETEARWRLVETAWELGVSRNLLNVKYDSGEELLFVDDSLKRKDVTSARDALNGYQKGKCFYCFDDISVNMNDDNACDVDHFFPHTLQKYVPFTDLNGVWNLVLACKECNRGENGKFARLPDRKYLARLAKRNDFLISSHHPLRETLMQQNGRTVEERRAFMNKMYDTAMLLGNTWKAEQKGPEVF